MNFETYFLKEQVEPEWECVEGIIDLINTINHIYPRFQTPSFRFNDYEGAEKTLAYIKSLPQYFRHKKIHKDVKKYYFKDLKPKKGEELLNHAGFESFCAFLVYPEEKDKIHLLLADVGKYATLQDWIDYHLAGHPEKRKLEEKIFNDLKNKAQYNPRDEYGAKIYRHMPDWHDQFRQVKSLKEINIISNSNTTNNGDDKNLIPIVDVIMDLYSNRYIIDYVLFGSLYKIYPSMWVLIWKCQTVDKFISQFILRGYVGKDLTFKFT